MNRWVLGALAGVIVNCMGLGDAAAAEPPDLVRLKNGGMVRGTIQEYVPGDHVTITLPNGEERRIAGDEVAEAGPAVPREATPAPAAASFPAATAAPAAPAAPAPPRVIATVKGDQAPINFTHEGEDPIAFHVRTGTQTAAVSGGWGGRTISVDAYEQICSAPCTADMRKGTHKLALSRSDGKPLGVEELVTIDGPATMNGTYESFSGMRTAGWLLVLGGAVTMVVGPLAALKDCGDDFLCDDFDEGVAIAMVAAGGVAMITGFIFAFKSDKATVTVQPGVSAARSHRNVAHEPSPRGTPLGLTGALRF
jgi:hypothetical protein